MPSAVGRVLVCRAGRDRFTIPVQAVREVVEMPPVSRLPGTAAAIRGMVNVRGVLVTVISGAVLMGAAAPIPGEYLVRLVLQEGRVAIEVDDVEDLHTTGSAGQVPALDLEAVVKPLLRTETARA